MLFVVNKTTERDTLSTLKPEGLMKEQERYSHD